MLKMHDAIGHDLDTMGCHDNKLPLYEVLSYFDLFFSQEKENKNWLVSKISDAVL